MAIVVIMMIIMFMLMILMQPSTLNPKPPNPLKPQSPLKPKPLNALNPPNTLNPSWVGGKNPKPKLKFEPEEFPGFCGEMPGLEAETWSEQELKQCPGSLHGFFLRA